MTLLSRSRLDPVSAMPRGSRSRESVTHAVLCAPAAADIDMRLAALLLCAHAHVLLTHPVQVVSTRAADGVVGPPRKNLFVFHAGGYLGSPAHGPWQLYPWDRIQTVGVFSDHSPDLIAKAASEGAKFALATDPADDVIDPHKTNASVRAAWIKAAVARVQAANATGLNIDHEATMVKGSAESAAFSALLSELGTALRAAVPGAELSFDAAARPCYEHRCYNYSAIAAAVDRVFVMVRLTGTFSLATLFLIKI